MGSIDQELTPCAALKLDMITMDTSILKRQSLRNWGLLSNPGAAQQDGGKVS